MSDKCAKKCIFMLVPGALPLKGKLCTLKSVIWEALFIFILSSTSTWYSLSFKSSCHPDLPNRHCSNQSVVGMATARYGVDTTVSLASIFRLPPYVARHYTGTNSCSTMVRITAPPPLSPRLPTLRKPQTSTWRVKRWMKVTPPTPSHHPRRPRTLTMSWSVVRVVLWLVCVTLLLHLDIHIKRCQFKGHLWALQTSVASGCLGREGSPAGMIVRSVWECQAQTGLPGSVSGSGVAPDRPSPTCKLIGPYCSLFWTQ